MAWANGTSRATGIAAANLLAGANLLGSAEIDNSSLVERYCAIEVTFSCSVAPSPNKVVEVYIVYATDGTNYEDGDGSTDPTLTPAACVATRNTTGVQKVAISGIPIQPFKYKILLKSELGQNIDNSSLTVLCYTYSEAS